MRQGGVKGEQGFALVIALIVMTLVVALLVEFVNEVYVDASHSHNFVDSQQASILAESGVQAGIKLLQSSAMFRNGKAYSSLNELWAKPQSQDAGVGTVTISIEEESGKLDLNAATSQTGTPVTFYQKAATRLLTKLELSQDLYDALFDWVDTDDTPRPGGAEKSYYLNLKQPYQIHNNRLDTVEELALVKGFTPDVLTKLRPCVTVYGSGLDYGTQQAKININTAPPEVLASLDDELARGDMVDRILEYRKTKPITNLNDIPGIGTLATSLQLYVGFQGSIYRIHAEGKVGETVGRVEAVVTGIEGNAPKILYWREY